jgi:Spy/CpxP family protein refolding chaperone
MRLHRSRHLTLFCALLGIALLAGPALAQQRGGRASTPGGLAEGRMMKRNAKELGLSEDTVTKIDVAIEAGKAEEAKYREENRAAIEALNEVLSQGRPNEKKLMAASAKVGESAAKSRELKMRTVIEMRALLTDEQLEKFMEIRGRATSRR